jgi:hypothetical protein
VRSRNRSRTDPELGAAATGSGNPYSRGDMELDRSQVAPRVEGGIDSPFGYKYKNELISPWNLDRPQVVIETISGVDFRGYTLIGSGALPTGSAFERVDDAWENMWQRLIEKAESPPFNYTAPTQTLTDNTAVREYFEILFPAAWNLSILHQLMNAVTYNEGMNTLSDDFRGKFRRINDLMVHFRSLRSIPMMDQLLDKFCNVVVPYNGGPIYARLHDLYHQPFTGTNPCTNWAAAIDLDQGVTSADVIKLLLDDIEEAYEELSGQAGDSASETQRTDYRQIVNIMAALGMPTLALTEKRIKVDPHAFALQFVDLFTFVDTKGVGTNKMVGYPVATTADSFIHKAFPVGYAHDWRDFIGFLPNAVLTGEVDVGGDNVIYGILRTGYGPGEASIARRVRVYTAEDGWATFNGEIDVTAADAFQNWAWEQPWFTKHMWSSKVVNSEEDEEDYIFYGPELLTEFDMRHDDLGKGLFRAIHDKAFGGFDVPVIR